MKPLSGAAQPSATVCSQFTSMSVISALGSVSASARSFAT
jgi:hypothetical protein